MMFHRALAVVTAILLSAPLGRAAEVDPYLPEDSESVFNLHVRQILDSQIVKKNFLEAAQEALRGNDEVQDIFKDLGFDPFKDLDRILIAAPGGTEKDRGLVIVHGRFDVAKFKAKAEKVAKDDAEHLKIHKILGGKHLLYEVNVPDLDDPLFVALAGRDTLLASPGKDYVVDALKKIGKTRQARFEGQEIPIASGKDRYAAEPVAGGGQEPGHPEGIGQGARRHQVHDRKDPGAGRRFDDQR